MKKYIFQAKKPFILELLFHLFYTASIASLPYIIQHIVDCKYTNGITDVIHWCLIFAGAAAFGMVAQYVSQRCAWGLDRELYTALRQDLFHAILSKEPNMFWQKSIGEYSSQINNDVTVCIEYVTNLSLILEGAISLVAYAVFVFLMDWRIAVVLYITSFLLLFLPKLTGKKFSQKQQYLLRETGIYTAKVLDLLKGYQMVSSDTEKRINARHRKSLCQMENARYDFGKFKTFTNVLNGSVMYLSNTIAVAVLAYFLFRGQITGGVAAATIAYVQEFMSPVRDIIDSISGLKSLTGVKNQVIQDISDMRKRTAQSVSFERCIQAENISYAYAHFAVNGFSRVFEKGKKYAIVGGSGTGKSTILNLLTGNLKPQAGRVMIDGRDATFDLCTDIMFYVNQQSHIFAEPFKENATIFGSFSQNVDLQAFLPTAKYKTLIQCQDCSTLSGGEKQLISLFRALLSEREILILDEPFSALDADTELFVCQRLLAMPNKTILLITHNEQSEYLRLFDDVITV